MQAAYLDLPVYEYVRQSAPVDPPGTTPVLYLRSFSENYQKERLEGVRHNMQAALSKTVPGNRLYSVIDEASPRLAASDSMRRFGTESSV